MAVKKGKGPAPLDSKVARKLLDKLSTDNDFRRLFKKDAGAALAKVGYKPDTGATAASGCMQLKSTDRIAPKAQIVSDRVKLERSMNSVINFDCAKLFQFH